MRIINRDNLRRVALSVFAKHYRLMSFIPDSFHRPRVQIIHLHSIEGREEERLHGLFKELSKWHHFISYSEAVRRIQEDDIDRPYIAVTFDDGLKSCARAVSILDQYGIKGCFFVCPSIIGETDRGKIDRFCRDGLLVPPTEFLSWNDIEQMMKNGHEIGSHTMTHSNLAKLSRENIIDEIHSSLMLLKEHVGNVKHFAWPFGRFFHFSRQAADAVFDAGLFSCASGVRGCHVETGAILKRSDICIRRDHVIANWPLEHVLFFLANNSRKASPANNDWPREYTPGAKL